ncbi:SWIM zinc finger family protein [Thermocatellispora tengchongensis]|uniref:hypothetical protein n=1 Tax=Thermocatellispora tengchongensis TaxID=1073253 RepID=UPI0031E7F8B4
MNAPDPAGQLPPVAPQVTAAAVESLTSRLRKKLDAAVEQYAALPVTAEAGEIRVVCGEDTVVTLTPGPSGTITQDDQARCSCLLAPRCLHRAAVLTACPIAGPATPAPAPDAATTEAAGDAAGDAAEGPAPPGAGTPDSAPHDEAEPGRTPSTGQQPADGAAGDRPAGPVAALVAAARAVWAAAAAVLAAGVPGAGAVPQAELLRAAHTARLAGLPRAEAAALRVVRGLRAARDRHNGHSLAGLVAALRELLLTAGRLARGDAGPGLIGSVRRDYRPGGGLRVFGVCREPVISATGYAGVVTHLVSEDGRWFSVADVRPGGPARARGAGTATVALGSGVLDHARLARAGLLVTGATVSPDGRLGAGSGVRATPLPGMPWTEGPMAALFARPLAEAANARLSGDGYYGDDPDAEERARELVGCDLMILGPAGDHVLARELLPAQAGGPLIRLVPASRHPGLAHVENLRRLASRPGALVRVVGRVDPARAATLLPLAVGPVPGATATLRLPQEWQDRADLGYDRLQGSHLPPAAPQPATETGPAQAEAGIDAASPLWRVRRVVEVAVAGGRRAVAEAGRERVFAGQDVPLRRAGFRGGADLGAALTAEADRRTRDVFGRPADSGPDAYAWAWLAAATYLEATERAVIRASWQP